jgi:hypothetical protein
MSCRKPVYSTTPQRCQSWLLGLLLVAATAVVLGPVVHYDFVVWDDNLHVYENPRLHPVTWEKVLAFWQAPYANLYIPLTYTVWAALAWLTHVVGPEPLTAGLFHQLNLLLHLGSVLVVYRLGLLLLAQNRDPDSRIAGAAVGALLFGVHPLQVEATAWVSGLKDTLCGWWALVAIWQYLEYIRASTRKRCGVHYGLATVAYGLALLAKPAAIAVPVMVCVLDTFILRRSWQHVARALGGWLVVAGLWGIWTKGQQAEPAIGFITPLWARPIIAADAITFYLGKLLWPIGLGPDYGRTPQMVLEQGVGYITAPITLLLGLGLWCFRRQLWGVAVAILVLVAGLLPVLGGVPFLFQDYSTVADRYVYLAMVGPALGLGWVVQRLGRRRLVWLGSMLILALLGWQSAEQVQVWHNTVTLFTHALQVNPSSALAHNNLGLTVAQQGKLDEAATHFHTALRLKPHLPEAHYNLGNVLMLQGKLDEASASYTTALQLRPPWAEAHNNLGVVLAAQGKLPEALVHYAQALLLKPDFAQAHANISKALTSRQERFATQELSGRDIP